MPGNQDRKMWDEWRTAAYEPLATGSASWLDRNHQAATLKHANHAHFSIHGYQEEGTTTTPFAMPVRNYTSRYHLVLALPPSVGKDALMAHCKGMLAEHVIYIRECGKDMELN